jgi:hypothetical protein
MRHCEIVLHEEFSVWISGFEDLAPRWLFTPVRGNLVRCWKGEHSMVGYRRRPPKVKVAQLYQMMLTWQERGAGGGVVSASRSFDLHCMQVIEPWSDKHREQWAAKAQ